MRRRLTEPVGFHVHHLEHVARLRHRLEDKGPVDEEAQPADALLWPRVSHPRCAVVHDLAIGPRLERAHGEARVVGKREGLAACIVVEEREGVGIEARAAGERQAGHRARQPIIGALPTASVAGVRRALLARGEE